MTVLFSIATSNLITMTADSAVTLTSGDRTEYDTGRKVYHFPGIGCVGTWGARQGNKVGHFLEARQITQDTHSVIELADLVYDYLRCEYQPHKDGLEDIGFHVAGFDRDGLARLYHVFWGIDRPSLPNPIQGYKKYDHSPATPEMIHSFLYNGRNDLAQVVLNAIGNELRLGKGIRFDLLVEDELVLFADFITRFAAEITPEVGPPFYTFLISPKNQIEFAKNESFCPVNREEVRQKLSKLGYEFS